MAEQDVLDAIAEVKALVEPYEGGFDPTDTPVESFEDQTITYTLKDGTVRKDFAFVEEEEE